MIRILALALLLSCSAVQAKGRYVSAYSCPSGTIVIGDPPSGVLSRCGAPSEIIVGHNSEGELVEHWRYRFGNKAVSLLLAPEGLRVIWVEPSAAKK